MTANRIDVIDMACEEYSQEVLEADSFLAIEDDPTSPKVDPTSPKVDPTYYDPDGDILLLKAILNINEPSEIELKDLPPYLEYAFLEGNDKLPVIISKDLKNEEKAPSLGNFLILR
ncbi:hypothetical protein Tco_0069892, partial [Tanacetum coccineum]